MEMELRGKRNQLDKRVASPGQMGCYVINWGVWWTQPSAPKFRNESKKGAEKTDNKMERIKEREGGREGSNSKWICPKWGVSWNVRFLQALLCSPVSIQIQLHLEVSQFYVFGGKSSPWKKKKSCLITSFLSTLYFSSSSCELNSRKRRAWFYI